MPQSSQGGRVTSDAAGSTVILRASVPARLAVLIPTNTARDALARTIASIRVQAVPHHVVIVDDGSHPPVTIAPTVSGDCVTLIRMHRHRGVTGALNVGLGEILAGSYEYVARQDAGDVDVGDRLAKQMDYLDRCPDTVMVGAWTGHCDRLGKHLFVTEYPTSWPAVRRRMRYRSAFSHSACMLRVSALRRFGGYDERYDIAQDLELFRRLAEQAPCVNLPEILVVRAEEPTAVTTSRRWRSAWVRLLIQLRYFSARDPHAALGIGRSLLALAVPGRVVFAVKRFVGRVR